MGDSQKLSVDTYALNEDDLGPIVGKCQYVPDSHTVARQAEFVGARQRVIVGREWVSKRRHRLLKQVSEGAKHRLPLRFGYRFDV